MEGNPRLEVRDCCIRIPPMACASKYRVFPLARVFGAHARGPHSAPARILWPLNKSESNHEGPHKRHQYLSLRGTPQPIPVFATCRAIPVLGGADESFGTHLMPSCQNPGWHTENSSRCRRFVQSSRDAVPA